MQSREEILIALKGDVSDLTKKLKSAQATLQSSRQKMQSEISKVKMDFFPRQQDIRKEALKTKEALTRATFLPASTMFSSDKGLMAKAPYVKELKNKYQEQMNALKALNIEQADNIRGIEKRYTPAINKAQKSVSTLSSSLNENQHMVATQQNALAKTKAAIDKTRKSFAGWAMSIMFFGMAITRATTSIWKFGTAAFQEISHSVENSTTAFDMLEGSMKYLGFMVGQALEPLAEALIPIVERIAEIIEKHPKLIAGFVLWGSVLGALFSTGGMLVLALNGFIELAAKMGIVTMEAGKIASWNFGGIKSGVDRLKNAFVRLGDYIGGVLKDNINWIKNNPIKSIMGGLVLAGIIMAVLWLIRLSEEMGGLPELAKNAGRGLMRVLAYYSAGIQAVILMAQKMWYNIFNSDGGSKMTVTFGDAFKAALEDNLKKIDSVLQPEKGYIQPRTLKQIWQADLYGEQQEASAIVNQQVVLNVENGASYDQDAMSRTLSAFEQYAQQTSGN